VAWVVVAVPAEISGMMLEAGGRRRGGLPIFQIKEAILGFFTFQNSVLLEAGPH
jgi:hypothetical protein